MKKELSMKNYPWWMILLTFILAGGLIGFLAAIAFVFAKLTGVI
jgi:type III secretory pathway component EscT